MQGATLSVRAPMDNLRKYFWLLVIVGIIFMSTLIVLIFLLINKCISRQGKLQMMNPQRRYDLQTESNKYQERNLDTKTPPLPPRTQFLTTEAQSYENLAEGSDGEQSVADYEEIKEPQPENMEVEEEAQMLSPSFCSNPNSNLKPGDDVGLSYENLAEDHDYMESTDQLPDYISVEDEPAVLPPPQSLTHCASVGQSYENLAEDHDYEQSTDDQPDYMRVEDDDAVFPYPPDPAADNASTDDYDDIGGEDENQDEDDYDDVV